MTYQCNRCGRLFSCSETISFCPFCGTAYALQSIVQQPITHRIVIGSDSERTVQEKYWCMARIEINRILSNLDDQIPDEDQFEDSQLDLNEWLKDQKQCRSTTQFKKHCDAFLSKISSALQNATSKEIKQEPIDIDWICKKIKHTCLSLSEVLGQAYMPDKQPVLSYVALPVDRSKDNGIPKVPEAYHQLLQAVVTTKPALYTILDDNGIFVALSVLGNLSPEEAIKRKPIDLSKQLYVLAEKDYDPLFGEEYDDFVQAFWEAILRLAYVVNNALALPEFDENEIAKISALQSYLSDWKNVLNVMLDQLYQSQQHDMVGIHKNLHQLRSSLECNEN